MNINTSREKISGIYKIRNRDNDKYYIGSSKNIQKRWREHLNGLRGNRHENEYLQRAWNKYGEKTFEFEIVENIEPEYLLLTEQRYLDCVKQDLGDKCYNLSPFAAGGAFAGHKHTEESKQKTREKILGRKESLETRQRKSDSLTGRIGGFVGKTQTNEWKKKNSERMKHWWSLKRTKS